MVLQADNDDDWSEFAVESKKASKLEATSMISHTVHCPYFPAEKQVLFSFVPSYIYIG